MKRRMCRFVFPSLSHRRRLSTDTGIGRPWSRHYVDEEHREPQPLRVWSKSSTRETLLLIFIAQMTASMVRYNFESSIERKKIDGRRVDEEVKPSIDTICRNLVH